MHLGFPRAARVLKEHGVIFSEKAHENIEVADLFGLDMLRRSMQVGGTGSLFWKYNADRDYPDRLKSANRNFRELSQLENVRPHDWRRTGRTHLSSLGVREEVAEAAMNHCKEDLKRVYNLYEFWPERKEALRLWHEKIDRLSAEAMTRAA